MINDVTRVLDAIEPDDHENLLALDEALVKLADTEPELARQMDRA